MTKTQLESKFQADLIVRLRELFPGCIIQKLDEQYQTGIPDLLILWGDRWATLECKRSLTEPYRPGQEWFIDVMNQMSFSSMICPENKEEVLHALQYALRVRR